MTHDERLREHILANSNECETRLVSRAVSNGAVVIQPSEQLWKQLLEDATIIFNLGNSVPGALMSVTDTVRGLCRQSVDNALREFVTFNAIENGRDYATDIQILDLELTTSSRFLKARDIYLGPVALTNPALKAQTECQQYLHAWNMASHGNPQTSEVVLEEITAAEKACSLLTKRISHELVT